MKRGLLAALVSLPGVANALDAPPPGLGWTEANRTAEIVIYTHDNAQVGARDVYAVAEIDAPPADVFAVLSDFEHYADFMPYTKETRVIARQGEDRLTVYQRLTPPIVDERDYVIEVTLSEEGGGVYESRWTSAPDAVPLADGCVRVRINSGSWRVEPLPGDRSRLTHRLQTHPGGSIPTWVADRSNTVAIPALFTAIRRQVALGTRG